MVLLRNVLVYVLEWDRRGCRPALLLLEPCCRLGPVRLLLRTGASGLGNSLHQLHFHAVGSRVCVKAS